MNGYWPLTTRPRNGGLFLPGSVGVHADTPDAAGLQLAGDVDLRVRFSLPGTAPSSNCSLISKYQNVTAGYEIQVLTDGRPNLRVGTTHASGTALPIAAGVPLWLRATYNNTTGSMAFYLSDNGVEWAPHGNAVAATAGAAVTGSQELRIGERSTNGNNAPVTIYEAQVRDGIDGDVVAHPIFSHPVTGWTTNGATMHDGYRLWTIDGATWEWRE